MYIKILNKNCTKLKLKIEFFRSFFSLNVNVPSQHSFSLTVRRVLLHGSKISLHSQQFTILKVFICFSQQQKIISM